jgi:DNA-directed RNA polymerase subunit M/transcription elongation factor TFIIS
MPSTVPALLLTQNGEVKNAKVTIQSDEQGCQLADIQKYLKKKIAPTLLGTYPWKNQTLHLVGYKDGKAGTENQHELPPPHDKDLYFGDIILLLAKEKKSFAKPIPMKSDEYENFYTQMFEGFDDLEESDSEDDDEDEFDEEEEEDGQEVEGGEFEENEEQADFSDDNDDQQSVEEFDVNVKKEKEEEEEFQPILVKKKQATKASKGKSKGAKETPSLSLATISELKPEETVSLSLPKNAHRANVCTAIQKILGQLLTETQSYELEHYIYNMSLQVATKRHVLKSWVHPLFAEVYSSLARSVVGNLNPNSYIQNKDLYKRFKEKKITLEEITTFTFSDLYPEIWKDLSIRQFEREKRQLEGNKSMATDQFECKRCHKRECTYYELQTRSADEPMTIFIQCVNCGKHWRQ